MTMLIDAGRIKIGAGNPCFIIAEAGVNHNGNLGTARGLMDVAGEAGADAVKFQTFKAERIVAPDAPKAEYQISATGSEESQLEMLKRLELSRDDHRELISHSREKGIPLISSPFDEESADLLDELGMVLFKIPSGEITNLPLIDHVARKGKPMLVSTGMACLGEVEAAVQAIERAGNHGFALLHCVSNYPAEPEEVNLRAMSVMAAAFQVPVGYSDHTQGIEVSLAAAALGACVIEKHFTLDRSMPGPDHASSLEPDELAALVEGVRKVEAALGHGRKQPAAREAETAVVVRKSLFAAYDIRAGARLESEMIAVKRPGTGLPPSLKSFLVGRRACVDIPAGTLLTWEMIA